jgi:hypothetical protein
MEWKKYKISILLFLCLVTFGLWVLALNVRDCSQHPLNPQVYKIQGIVKNYEYQVYIWGTIATMDIELADGKDFVFVAKIPPFSNSYIKVGLTQSFYFKVKEVGNYPEVIQITTYTSTGPIIYKPHYANCFTIDESKVILRPEE